MKLVGFARLDDEVVHIAVEVDGNILEMTYDSMNEELGVETHGEMFTIQNYGELMAIITSGKINLPF